MSSLPEELWRRILEIGIERSGFTYKDLCCISISCRLLHRLSSEDPLWSRLLSSDFSDFTHPPPPPKSLYKFRRAELRKLKQVRERSRRLQDVTRWLADEARKDKEIVTELSILRTVREVSEILCQPEVVSGWQEQMVEFQAVGVESRIHALEMEHRLCKQQIMRLEESRAYHKERLDTAQEELVSMMYHPLLEHKPLSRGENEHKVKGKKMKSCNGCEALTLVPSFLQYLSKKSNYWLPKNDFIDSHLLVC